MLGGGAGHCLVRRLKASVARDSYKREGTIRRGQRPRNREFSGQSRLIGKGDLRSSSSLVARSVTCCTYVRQLWRSQSWERGTQSTATQYSWIRDLIG